MGKPKSMKEALQRSMDAWFAEWQDEGVQDLGSSTFQLFVTTRRSHQIRELLDEWPPPPPRTLTRHEVSELVKDHLSVEPSQFGEAWTRFSTCIELRGGEYASSVMSSPFLLGKVRRGVKLPTFPNPPYKFPSGIVLGLGGPRYHDATITELSELHVVARLLGDASESAMTEAVRVVRPIARAVFRSLMESNHFPGGNHYCTTSGPTPDQSGFDLFGIALDVVFGAPDKKDKVAARLRSAIQLLAASDQQENPAISLALSCAAMEAMLTTQKPDITQQLADRATALLAPADMDVRFESLDAVKKLYGARSKILHGERLETDPTAVEKARVLASGILKAAMEWRRWAKRFGADVTSEEAFFREIEVASRTNTRLMGVPEYLSGCLPSAKPPEHKGPVEL